MAYFLKEFFSWVYEVSTLTTDSPEDMGVGQELKKRTHIFR